MNAYWLIIRASVTHSRGVDGCPFGAPAVSELAQRSRDETPQPFADHGWIQIAAPGVEPARELAAGVRVSAQRSDQVPRGEILDVQAARRLVRFQELVRFCQAEQQ